MTSVIKKLLHHSDHTESPKQSEKMADFEIPKEQYAAVRVGKGPDGKAPLQKIDVVMPGPSEILVNLKWYK
jgi:hypothetical protein